MLISSAFGPMWLHVWDSFLRRENQEGGLLIRDTQRLRPFLNKAGMTVQLGF